MIKKEVIKFCFSIFEMNNWDFLLHRNNRNQKCLKGKNISILLKNQQNLIEIAVFLFVDILQDFSFSKFKRG